MSNTRRRPVISPDDISVTLHARRRSKERLGIPKRAVDRMARNAWEHGLRHADLKGRLRKFIDSRVLFYGGTHTRIFAEKVFVFSVRGELITIVPLPLNLMEMARTLSRQHKHPGV